jgi:transposase-like protein
MSGLKKRVKNYNRYPNSLKRKIAKSYLSGQASYAILAEENGLRDKTVVKEFVKWYRRKLELEPGFDIQPEMPENPNILSEKELQVRVRELEKELLLAKLKAEMLETIIDLAEGQFNLDIRKKSGAKQ